MRLRHPQRGVPAGAADQAQADRGVQAPAVLWLPRTLPRAVIRARLARPFGLRTCGSPPAG
jgi:hypothetical protein